MNDRFGLALMMIREGCEDPRGLAAKVLDGASAELEAGMRELSIAQVIAAQKEFANRGIDFALPWDGDLDDLERERFQALCAAIAAANEARDRAQTVCEK